MPAAATSQIPTEPEGGTVYRQTEAMTILGKVTKFFGGGNDGPSITQSDEQLIRESIYGEFKKLITSVVHCWNDLPIFVPRDFHFLRSGVFPYTTADDLEMSQLIQKSYLRFRGDQ
jgi:hypothetical protein